MAHLTRVGWLSITRPVTMGVRALIRDRSGAVLLMTTGPQAGEAIGRSAAL